MSLASSLAELRWEDRGSTEHVDVVVPMPTDQGPFPAELYIKIFELCDTNTLKSCRLASKYLHDIASTTLFNAINIFLLPYSVDRMIALAGSNVAGFIQRVDIWLNFSMPEPGSYLSYKNCASQPGRRAAFQLYLDMLSDMLHDIMKGTRFTNALKSFHMLRVVRIGRLPRHFGPMVFKQAALLKKQKILQSVSHEDTSRPGHDFAYHNWRDHKSKNAHDTDIVAGLMRSLFVGRVCTGLTVIIFYLTVSAPATRLVMTAAYKPHVLRTTGSLVGIKDLKIAHADTAYVDPFKRSLVVARNT